MDDEKYEKYADEMRDLMTDPRLYDAIVAFLKGPPDALPSTVVNGRAANQDKFLVEQQEILDELIDSALRPRRV